MSTRRALAFRVSALAALLSASLLPMSHHAGASGPFTAPVVVTSDDTGEPGIDVGLDGAIYVNAPSSLLNGSSWVYKSTNGGASWVKTNPGQRDLYPGGGDSDIAVDPVNGKLYMTDLYLGSSTVSVSKNGAGTWKANPLQGVFVQDRQWVASTGDNIVYHSTHQIPVGIVVSKSIGGLVYPIHVVAATVLDQTLCVCAAGNLVVSPATKGIEGKNDHVGVIYPTSTNTIKFARSLKGGATWSQSTIYSGPVRPQEFPIAAADHEHLAAVWNSEFGGTSSVMFSQSFNFGATWSTPVTLVSSGSSLYPWVDVKGTKIAVSLYHSDTAGSPDGVPNSAQWFETYLESNNTGATWSALTTVDSAIVKTGPICVDGLNCGTDRELLDYQSLTLDALSRANLTWTRSLDGVSNTELRFARQT